MLKALFDESFTILRPVIPDVTGSSLAPYSGIAPLTLVGEFNKLAINIAIPRNTAGVHWRTDSIAGLLLGEQVAIGILKDCCLTFTEEFEGFTFHRFSGKEITITG